MVGSWIRSASIFEFVARNIPRDRLASGGGKVLEVGSFDPLSGYRSLVDLCGDGNEYVGVDITEGTGVDTVCPVEEVLARFGPGSFDVVIATELLEHIDDWRGALSALKNVCAPGGTVILTTRSRGYAYHGTPFDYWRFEVDDVEAMFSDFQDLRVEKDSCSPGVFTAARRPADLREKDLSEMAVYGVAAGRRLTEANPDDFRTLRFARVLLASKIRFLGIWLFSYARKEFRAKLVSLIEEGTALAGLLKRGRADRLRPGRGG